MSEKFTTRCFKKFNDFLEELPDALLEVYVRQRLNHMNRQAQRFGYTEKNVVDGIEIPKYFSFAKVAVKSE